MLWAFPKLLQMIDGWTPFNPSNEGRLKLGQPCPTHFKTTANISTAQRFGKFI